MKPLTLPTDDPGPSNPAASARLPRRLCGAHAEALCIRSHAVDHSIEGISVLDRSGRYVEVNAAYAAQLGYVPEELVGKSWREALHPDDLPIAAGAFARMLATGRSEFEARGVRRDGSVFQKRVVLMAYHLPGSGALVGHFCFAEDVSARKEAKEELRRRERHFRRLIENASDLIATLDADATFTYLGPSIRRVLGHEPEALVGTPAANLVHEDDTPRLRTELAAQAAGPGTPRSAELRFRHADGTWRVLELVGTAEADEDGRLLHILNARDITLRRLAEESLRASETRYRLLYERNLAGVYRATFSGTLLDCNEAFARIFGYSREEAMALGTQNFYADPSDRVALVSRLRSERSLSNIPFRGRGSDGRMVHALANVVLLDEIVDGDHVMQGTLVDVTERHELQEQLLHAQKMEAIGRLAGGVAHDFNNLLTAILGFGALLSRRLGPTEELDEILRSAERAARLTKQLLAFSRKQVLAPEVLDLNDVLREIRGMLRRLVEENVAVVVAPHPAPAFVKVDRGQLEQVVMNLAVNARDAMPGGGTLHIETSAVELPGEGLPGVELGAGPYVLLRVRDDGHGMSAETMARIFEPFFTTKAAEEGTGLGLSTVYGIVRQSGGAVRCLSEVGAGATFEIYLPGVEGDARPVRKERVAPVPGGDETILLAEDDEPVRLLVSHVLRGVGYTVLEASSGDEAARLSGERPGRIDLLLTDMVMPGLGGLELSALLAGERPGLRVLFMSGYTSDPEQKAVIACDPSTFLRKPFSLDELVRKVRTVLDAGARASRS